MIFLLFYDTIYLLLVLKGDVALKPFSYHVHSEFCDGRSTAEEMVLAAIQNGFDSLGFSSHSHLPNFPELYGMKKESIAPYCREILRLKEAYKDKINIFLGIEQDSFSLISDIPSEVSYVIGSVHHVVKDGSFMPVDHSIEHIKEGVKKLFYGDILAYVEAYYDEMSKIYDKTHCDIVGHIDLLTKFNETEFLIDTNSMRYKNAALSAAEKLARRGLIFEINTGAIGRGYRTAPYPSEEILKVIYECGGKITYSSDCHKADSIAVGFEDAIALAKKCGFKSFMKLGSNGFYEEKF